MFVSQLPTSVIFLFSVAALIYFYGVVCTHKIVRYVWLSAHLLLLPTMAKQPRQLQGRLSARHGNF
jgi:hypothetical protein